MHRDRLLAAAIAAGSLFFLAAESSAREAGAAASPTQEALSQEGASQEGPSQRGTSQEAPSREAPAQAAEAREPAARNRAAQQNVDSLGFRGVGFRAGLNTFPNQFVFGAHVDAGEFYPAVRFQPSFTIGLGDDRTIGMANVDVIYVFHLQDISWRPYAGSGLGIGFIDSDKRDNLEVKAGLNLLGGFEWEGQNRYFVEARTSIGTSLADFTLVGGITF